MNGATIMLPHPASTIGVMFGPVEVEDGGIVDGNQIIKVSQSMTPVHKNADGEWERGLYASEERMDACD